MIAFQFPPFAGSSGVQRTLRFVQHLPAHGWEAIVLSASPFAYEATSDDLLTSIPPSTIVRRAFAFDSARHFSIAGRYPASLARPDRWSTWRYLAIGAGRKLIRGLEPAAIWSTYPIPTAHVIASRLHKISGLPWLADFRDPMAQENYPRDPLTWQCFARIERDTVQHARFSIFTTPGAAAMYRERYAALSPERFQIVENGYDEESFANLDAATTRPPLIPGLVTLLHSGALYASERDPTHLFAALGSLKKSGRVTAQRLRVRFRAAGQDDLLNALARQNKVEDLVELADTITYRAALEEMIRADGLLLMQAANCNQQIPAKLYEYLRAGKPILALTDSRGDTAGALRSAGGGAIARLDSAMEIEATLLQFLESIEGGTAQSTDTERARRNARRERAGELARLLEKSCGAP